MTLRMWMYDLAREQAPTLDHLREFCQLTLDSGYNALGIYLEHRFAYASLPQIQGQGVLTPEMVTTLVAEFPDLQIIPFVNLLGHCEGLIYTEFGVEFAAERFKGLQASASNEKFVDVARGMLADVMAAFSSGIIHIGGDETAQLAADPASKARVAQYESEGIADGKAKIYADHFGPIAQAVIEAGRRPAVWGDMFVEHPSALSAMPKETLIFDWQYFQSPIKTAHRFTEAGFDVVVCPAIHTYNAAWLHLAASERNVRDHVQAAHALRAYGVCVTTWECGLFGNYETMLPAIRGCGMLLQDEIRADYVHFDPADRDEAIANYGLETEAPVLRAAYLAQSESAETWAKRMGLDLAAVGGIFAFSGIRSSLKCRFMLYSNPFLFWLHHREEIIGEIGDRALALCEEAIAFAPDAAYRGVAEFTKMGIQFVRFTEESHRAYADGSPGQAVAALTPARSLFEDMARNAKANHLRLGGSLADIERCWTAREHVERVMIRIKRFGDGSLGYLPSYETISHPKFVPHDQGNWWLINAWANQ